MELTELQRWELIREMVKQKNKEYRNLLCPLFFNNSQTTKLLGITRDTFLSKCGYRSNNPIVKFEDSIRNSGRKPQSNWLDNLSSEDLLLFLDYRCRALQQIYKHCKMNRSINLNDIKAILEKTEVNELIGYNNGKLVCSGAPKRTKQEDKITEFDLKDKDLRQQAIIDTMGHLASIYTFYKKVPIEKSKDMALKLVTYTFDEMGHLKGDKLNIEAKAIPTKPIDLSISSKPVENSILAIAESQKKSEPEMKLVGFDKHMIPILLTEGGYINAFDDKVSVEDIKYDIGRNEIKRQTTTTQIIPQKELEDALTNAKHKGFDIQGTPIYEYNGEYYSSIGEKLPEDITILPLDDDLFEL